MKIQAHYRQFQHYLNQLPSLKDSYELEGSYVADYNSLVERLELDIQQSLDAYKIQGQPDDFYNGQSHYQNTRIRLKLGSLIGFLEGEFQLIPIEEKRLNSLPSVSIVNHNTIAITINQNIQQLIDDAQSEEEKNVLNELKDELAKPEKDWNKIKAILKWAIDFSEKLFFQLLPVVLRHYGINT